MRRLLAFTLGCALIGVLACGDDGGSSPTDSPAASADESPAVSTTPGPTSSGGALTDAELSGRLVYVVSGDGVQDIWIMNVDGSDVHALTSTPEAESYPDFSPDGSQIVFQRNSDIWVMNDDGSDARLLQSSGIDPAWSPDGTEITFSPLLGNNLDLAVINVETGAVRTLLATANATEAYPAWSPDGSTIAFLGSSPALGLYTVPADGSGAATAVTHESLLDAYPDWSPDGSQIAFVSPMPGHSVVGVVNSDGSNRRDIGDLDWTGNYPAWSPDGCCIAFSSAREDQNWDIFVMRADGSGIRRLTTAASIDGDFGIDWTE